MKNTVWHQPKISKHDRARLTQHKPFLIWITGLSGSGKSTLANALEQELFQSGYHTYLLDGDNVRHGLNRDLGFDHASRVENIRRVGEVGKLMVDAGLIVITAFISPFCDDRAMVREIFEPGEFIELYLSASLETCENRDPKGLYKQAREGKIKDFTGIDSPYEVPQNPELVIPSGELDVQEEVSRVLAYLQSSGYLSKS
jgi:adenylyl-sulfate kinase